MIKVVYVYFVFEKKDYFFGSIVVIYDYLSVDWIGVGYYMFWNVWWKEILVYVILKVIIKIGRILCVGSGRK